MPTEEVVLRLRVLLLSSQRLSQASGGFALRGSVISNIAEVFDPGASGARVTKLSFRLREQLGEDSQLQAAGIAEVKSLESWQEEVESKSTVWARLSLHFFFPVDSGNLFITRDLPSYLQKSTKYMTGGLAPVHAIVVLVDLLHELPPTKSKCLSQNRCIAASRPRTNSWCKGCIVVVSSWSKCDTTRMSNWLPRSLESFVLVGGSSLSWGHSRPICTNAFLKESTLIPRSFIRTFSRLHSPPKSSKGIRLAATKRHGLIGGCSNCGDANLMVGRLSTRTKPCLLPWPWPAVWLRDMPVVPSSFHKLSCIQKFFLTERSEKFFITCRRLVPLHLPKWLVEAAVAFLQLQNSILRTTYAVENGRMKQHVHSTLLDVLEYIEFGTETEDQILEERAQLFAEASMDLHNEPPFRVLCAHASGSDGPKTLLVVKVHHLAADGRSMNHLDKQLLRFLEWGIPSSDGEPLTQHLASLIMMPKLKPLLYDRSCRCIAARLPKWGQIPPQFSDYVSWVERYRQSDKFQRDLRYWRLQLKHAPARANGEATAATGRSMSAVVEANFPLNFPGDLTRQCSRSAFPVVMASLAATLCVLSQQDVVVIGSPVFGTPSGFEEVVGCLAHIVPYVIRMPAPFSVPEFLTSVHNKVEAVREHCILPVEEILSSARIESLQFSAILTWQPPGSWSRERFRKNSRAWGDKKFIGPSPLLANLVLDAYQAGFNRDKCIGSLAVNPKCFDIETAKDISKTLATVASKMMEDCHGNEFVNFRAWAQGVFDPCEVPGP